MTQVFEKQVKPINTLRFDEFLQARERDAQREAELERVKKDPSVLSLGDG